MAHTQMLAQFFFKVEHFSHRNVVKISMVCGEQRNGQFPHLQRLILRLLQQLGQPLAAFKLFAGCVVQIGGNCANAASSQYCARSVRMPPDNFLMILVCAAPPTRDTETPAFIAGRMPALNKSVSRKIWPSVIEITFVGTKAVTSPACVSITGSAVSEPLLPITAPFVNRST